MGNCLGLKSNQEDEEEEQTTNTPFELQRNYDYDHQIIPTPNTYTPDPTEPGSGSSTPRNNNTNDTDPRVMSLLEFFHQLHTRGNQIFQRITPVHREEIDNIFENMGVVMDQKKKKRKSDRMMNYVKKRSNSFGDVDTLRLNRFKVKPITPGAEKPADTRGGTGGGGTSKPTDGSK